ncbi:MAG: hypothetical protein ABI875_00710 [Gemmatimonadales bacterium]
MARKLGSRARNGLIGRRSPGAGTEAALAAGVKVEGTCAGPGDAGEAIGVATGVGTGVEMDAAGAG